MVVIIIGCIIKDIQNFNYGGTYENNFSYFIGYFDCFQLSPTK